MLNPSVSPETKRSEEERLAALRRCHILDTPAAPAFDRLTALAAHLFDVPYTGINFVDADRIWFKSFFGLSLRSMARPSSFCDCTLAKNDVFVSEDAAQDPRFCDNPLVVGPPHLRFYAGVPLHSPDGHSLGVLCLADVLPRVFPPESRLMLTSLAAVVMREVELHCALRRLEASEQARPDLPAFYLRLQKAYNHLEAWVGQRTAALESANQALEHEVLERQHAGAALQAAQAELEARVRGRTAALERANLELREQVAERMAAETRLAESRQRYRSLFEQNWDAVYSFNREGRFLSANAACETLCGYSPQELLQTSFKDLVVPEYRTHAGEMFQKALAGEAQHDEIAIIRKDGRRVEISVSKMPILIDGKIVGAFGISQDITRRRELERERERLLGEAVARADRDSLTGLPNHGAFHKRFQEALSDAKPLTVVLLDMDNFRFLNDAYGHIVGDDVLCRVAKALQEQIGAAEGVTVARYGGDEFAVLMPSAAPNAAETLRQALTARLDRLEFRPPGHGSAVPLPLSAGAACFPDDGTTRLELLSVADGRLRRAKTGGDGEVEHLRMTMSRSVEGFSMLDALVTAVDNKDRYTRQHSEDVLTYSRQIAEALGLDPKTRHTVAVAALLHDVGKIGIPDAILRKPGRLTNVEFEAVRQHPMMGAIIVGAVPGFEDALDAIRHHHERWDGGGYPFGLRGGETPLIARLMAVADAFSAMTTDRPYRRGLSVAAAISALEQGAGSQWDPQCVQAFVRPRKTA